MVRGLETGQKAALVINELQRGVAGDLSIFPALSEQVARRGIVPRLAALAEAFRASALPVVHCHIVHRPDFAGVPINNLLMAHSRKAGLLVDGNPAVDPLPGFLPQKDDFVLKRAAGMTPFYDNCLDLTLRHLGVETIVVAGVSSNLAVPGTVLGAADRGYQVVVAEDCIAGTSEEVHAFMLKEVVYLLATITNSANIMAVLGKQPAAT
jgi:nicotinamidase-related amidase